MEQILESGAKTILLHKENLSGIDFSIIYNTLQKDPLQLREGGCRIYLQAAARFGAARMRLRHATSSRSCSSPDKRYDLGDVGRYRINKKLDLDIDPLSAR